MIDRRSGSVVPFPSHAAIRVAGTRAETHFARASSIAGEYSRVSRGGGASDARGWNRRLSAPRSSGVETVDGLAGQKRELRRAKWARGVVPSSDRDHAPSPQARARARTRLGTNDGDRHTHSERLLDHPAGPLVTPLTLSVEPALPGQDGVRRRQRR